MGLHRKMKKQDLLSKLGVWGSQERIEGEREGREGSGEKGIAQLKTITHTQRHTKQLLALPLTQQGI